MDTTENKPPANSEVYTKEQYEADIAAVEKTKLGGIFPIIKKEIPRVLLSCITYFVVGYVYAFLRQFKDCVLYDVLETSAANWLKVIVFFSSFLIINITTGFLQNYGVNKGTDIFIIFMAVLFAAFSILVFVKDFLCPLGATEEFLNGNVFQLRGLTILSHILPLFNHFIMVIFYVIYESFGSILMSFVFMTYLNSKLTPNQMGRYIRWIYIFANLSLIAVSYSVKNIVNAADSFFSASRKYILYGSVCLVVSAMLMGVLGLKKLMDREFNKELYAGALDQKAENKKKKVKPGFGTAIRLVFGSKLLFCLTVMSLGYNLSSVIASTISKQAYGAYKSYLIDNPHLITEPGFNPNIIPYSYSMSENSLTAMIVIFLMLTPVFAKMFKILGVFTFATITLCCCMFSAITSVIFAAINYPYTNYGSGILFGIKFSSTAPVFKTECSFAMISNMLIKIGKYAFYDIVKENVATRIDPSVRALYKGVFDGVAAKGGKMLGSILGIILANITGVKDARYSTPFFSAVVLLIAIGWFFCIIDLHRNYKYAVENDTFLQDKGVKKGEVEDLKK